MGMTYPISSHQHLATRIAAATATVLALAALFTLAPLQAQPLPAELKVIDDGRGQVLPSAKSEVPWGQAKERWLGAWQLDVAEGQPAPNVLIIQDHEGAPAASLQRSLEAFTVIVHFRAVSIHGTPQRLRLTGYEWDEEFADKIVWDLELASSGEGKASLSLTRTPVQGSETAPDPMTGTANRVKEALDPMERPEPLDRNQIPYTSQVFRALAGFWLVDCKTSTFRHWSDEKGGWQSLGVSEGQAQVEEALKVPFQLDLRAHDLFGTPAAELELGGETVAHTLWGFNRSGEAWSSRNGALGTSTGANSQMLVYKPPSPDGTRAVEVWEMIGDYEVVHQCAGEKSVRTGGASLTPIIGKWKLEASSAEGDPVGLLEVDEDQNLSFQLAAKEPTAEMLETAGVWAAEEYALDKRVSLISFNGKTLEFWLSIRIAPRPYVPEPVKVVLQLEPDSLRGTFTPSTTGEPLAIRANRVEP